MSSTRVYAEVRRLATASLARAQAVGEAVTAASCLPDPVEGLAEVSAVAQVALSSTRRDLRAAASLAGVGGVLGPGRLAAVSGVIAGLQEQAAWLESLERTCIAHANASDDACRDAVLLIGAALRSVH